MINGKVAYLNRIALNLKLSVDRGIRQKILPFLLHKKVRP